MDKARIKKIQNELRNYFNNTYCESFLGLAVSIYNAEVIADSIDRLKKGQLEDKLND